MSIAMNTSILICGADKGGRDEKALEIAKSASKREDVLFFDAGETRGIADIRKFISNLSKKPYSSKILTAVISEAQNLTNEAQNALLKTLEEGLVSNQIILTTPSPFSVLPTISSRCRTIDLFSTATIKNEVYENLLSAKISERLSLCEKLDLDEWLKFVREIFRNSLYNQKISEEGLAILVKYLRLIIRINANKTLANTRLARYLAAISIPKDLPNLLA